MGVTWDELEALVTKADADGAMVTRIWHPAGPANWIGNLCEAVVIEGESAYQVSTGQIFKI